MKKMSCILALMLTVGVYAQEVPFTFKLQADRPTEPLPVEVILYDVRGEADTLLSTILRTSTPSVRRDKNYSAYSVTRRVDRRLPLQDSCRILFSVDGDTLSLRFPVSHYGIEAELHIDILDDAYLLAYPVVNVYRTGDSLGRLFYVGYDKPIYEKAPENKRRPFFNFQSYSDKPLYSGSTTFRLYVLDEQQMNSNNPFFIFNREYLYETSTSLSPHQSMRFSCHPSGFPTGNHRAFILFAASPDNHFSYRYGAGCRLMAHAPDRSIWRDARVQTWYVASCDFFLTTLDSNP